MFKSIGKYTYYGQCDFKNYETPLDNRQFYVEVGSFTSIGNKITFFVTEGVAHNHNSFTTYPFGNIHNDIFNNLSVPPRIQSKGNIKIGSDVWIGENVTIMSGVTVGDGAVIATNSHVFKDVEPYSVVGGNPSKFIKYRFDPYFINELMELKWWNLDDSTINRILPIIQQNPTLESIQQIRSII